MLSESFFFKIRLCKGAARFFSFFFFYEASTELLKGQVEPLEDIHGFLGFRV